MWVGIGAVGTFLVGAVVKGYQTSAGQVSAIVALVASIIAAKLTAA